MPTLPFADSELIVRALVDLVEREHCRLDQKRVRKIAATDALAK